MGDKSHLYANPIHYLGDIKVADCSTSGRVSISLGHLCSLIITEPDVAKQGLVAFVEALRILQPDAAEQAVAEVVDTLLGVAYPVPDLPPFETLRDSGRPPLFGPNPWQHAVGGADPYAIPNRIADVVPLPFAEPVGDCYRCGASGNLVPMVRESAGRWHCWNDLLCAERQAETGRSCLDCGATDKGNILVQDCRGGPVFWRCHETANCMQRQAAKAGQS